PRFHSSLVPIAHLTGERTRQPKRDRGLKCDRERRRIGHIDGPCFVPLLRSASIAGAVGRWNTARRQHPSCPTPGCSGPHVPHHSFPFSTRWSGGSSGPACALAQTSCSPSAVARAECLGPFLSRSSSSTAGASSNPHSVRSTGCATCARP